MATQTGGFRTVVHKPLSDMMVALSTNMCTVSGIKVSIFSHESKVITHPALPLSDLPFYSYSDLGVCNLQLLCSSPVAS